MPDFCAAFGCSNERNTKTKEQGITFHRFPKDHVKRQTWTLALRRRDFVPNDRSVVCSSHFKAEDFDRTGQTTRLREGVVPSVFVFSDQLYKVGATGKLPHKKLLQSVQMFMFSHQRTFSSQPHLTLPFFQDHQYALDPVKVKKKLTEAQEMVEELQRDLRNAKDRERRHKRTMKSLIEDLKCTKRRSDCCQQDHKKAHNLQLSENEGTPGSTDIKSVCGKDSVHA
uniref:THAP-type domain-containing protein n=1 Tax=Monopterus albus TaxID=43700 RepID=A0A3Q3IUG1_MONAL